jgi:hypothetical protein
MSQDFQNEDEWLDVADIDMNGKSNDTVSDVPIRSALQNAAAASTTTPNDPVLKAGVPNDGLPMMTRPVATRTETQSLYRSMQENAEKLLKSGSSIFHADLGDYHVLRDAFVSGLPAGKHQEFDCSACRHFMKNFGDLAMVDDQTGNLKPLFWKGDLQNDSYRNPVEMVEKLFEGKKVREVFQVNDKTINAGIAEAGGFHHMSFKFPTGRLRNAKPKRFGSATALELAPMLDRVLADNNVSTIQKAADLLLEDKLPYALTHKSAIRWLRDLIEMSPLTKVSDDVTRHNLLYLAAADSFLGCIHQLRSGALSTLLENIQLGLPFSTIKDKWIPLASPTAYMRPIAAPSSGNITAAESLFSELGLSKEDLARKYLLMQDLPDEVFMWRSPTIPAKPDGIFSELIPKSKPTPPTTDDDASIPPTCLTFASFVNRIVPNAKSIEYHLAARPLLRFLITGLPGTNPLMQWHTPSNLASHYVYVRPGPAEIHNLTPGWTPVTAIIPAPHLWEGIPATTTLPLPDDLTGAKGDRSKTYKHTHHGWRYICCLEGIEDNNSTSCLFPTFMKSELHGVRSTIEAYSNAHGIPRVKGEGPMVGGITITKEEGEMDHLFRVRDQRGRVGRYKVTLLQ